MEGYLNPICAKVASTMPFALSSFCRIKSDPLQMKLVSCLRQWGKVHQARDSNYCLVCTKPVCLSLYDNYELHFFKKKHSVKPPLQYFLWSQQLTWASQCQWQSNEINTPNFFPCQRWQPKTFSITSFACQIHVLDHRSFSALPTLPLHQRSATTRACWRSRTRWMTSPGTTIACCPTFPRHAARCSSSQGPLSPVIAMASRMDGAVGLFWEFQNSELRKNIYICGWPMYGLQWNFLILEALSYWKDPNSLIF